MGVSLLVSGRSWYVFLKLSSYSCDHFVQPERNGLKLFGCWELLYAGLLELCVLVQITILKG